MSIFDAVTPEAIQERWEAGEGGKAEIKRQMKTDAALIVVTEMMVDRTIDQRLWEVLTYLLERGR